MTKEINFKNIEVNVQRTIVEDGLLDIALGIALVLSGIYLMNTSMIFNYIWLPFALWMIEGARRKFIYPRVGFAKVKMNFRKVLKIFAYLLPGYIITIFVTWIAAGLFSDGQAINRQDLISWSLIIFCGISFFWIAFKFSVHRWYLHGALIIIGFLISREYDLSGVILGLGFWVIIIGLVVFVRYLNANPLKSIEDGGEADVSSSSQ